jgi:hypothetical protein
MMFSIRRFMAAKNRDDAGIGLIEILVASALGLVLLAAVGGAFISTSKITTMTLQNRNSTGAASNAMTEINEVIRLSTPITVSGQQLATPAILSATDKTLVITSLVDVTDPTNPAPSKVTIDTTSGSLLDTRCLGVLTNGFWTFSSCASTVTRQIAGTFVAPTAGQNALFTYLDANGNVLPLVSGALPSASYGLVGSILVSVNLAAPGSKTAPVYIQSKTGMPNLGIQKEAS